MIAWFIAGGTTTAFLVLWFFTAYQKLSRQKAGVDGAAQQVLVKRRMYESAKQTPHEEAAAAMLTTDLNIYRHVVQDYNRTLKPVYIRIPAVILGFRPVAEEEHLCNTCNAFEEE